MTLLDFFLLVAMFGFVWFGFWFGMIHMAGAVVGTVAGAWLAGHFYTVLSAPLEALVGTDNNWVRVLSFIVIFVAVNRLVGFGFYMVDRTFGFLIRIPFLKTIDRIAGALLGFVEGALVLGLTLYFASRVNLPLLLEAAIAASKVAARLTAFAAVLVPLLPDIIKQVQPYVPGVNLPIPN